MKTTVSVTIKGHLKITDDLGNILLDQDNAIHQENMSRVIARALSDEFNYTIYRIAFGTGGSSTDAASVTTINPPNTGVPPDVRTWDSRLYNEVFSEIIDAGNTVLNPNLGVDPGSADSNTGIRPGGDSTPSLNPSSVLHVSGPGVKSVEQGLISNVIITSVINSNDPIWIAPTNLFTFDEMGLYTSGLQALAYPGYQYVDVGNQISTNTTNLIGNTQYSFQINVNNSGLINVSFIVPSIYTPSNPPTFGQLCDALNSGNVTWNPSWAGNSPLPGGTTVSITDTSGLYTTISGVTTYGYLQFTSGSVGATSSVLVGHGLINDLFANNNLVASRACNLLNPIQGQAAGVQNNPLVPTTERERLLTHLTFSPITKGIGRSLTILYTLQVAVAPTLET